MCISAVYRVNGEPWCSPPYWQLYYQDSPFMLLFPTSLSSCSLDPQPFLSPIQSLLSASITYRIKCKPIHLFDIHHSLQSDARLASHLHHLKSLFSLPYFVCLTRGRCYLKYQYMNLWPIRLPKRGLWVLKREYRVFPYTCDDVLHGVTKKESWSCS